MKIQDVKVLVLGAGNWGKNHIKNLDAITKNWKAYDPDSEKLGEIINKYGQIHAIIRTEDLHDCDAVIVASTSSTHYDLTREYIDDWKHVLVEKPVVKSKEELDGLVNAVKDRPMQVFMSGHTMLYHPVMRAIRDMLEQGYCLKEPRFIMRRMKTNPIVGDDEVYRLLPHDLALLDYWDKLGTLGALKDDETFTNEHANVIVSWEQDPPLRDLYIVDKDMNTIYFNDYTGDFMYNNGRLNYDPFPPLMLEQLNFLSMCAGRSEYNPTGIEHTKTVYELLTKIRPWTPYEKKEEVAPDQYEKFTGFYRMR